VKISIFEKNGPKYRLGPILDRFLVDLGAQKGAKTNQKSINKYVDFLLIF